MTRLLASILRQCADRLDPPVLKRRVAVYQNGTAGNGQFNVTYTMSNGSN